MDLKAFYNNKIKSTDYSLSPEQLQFKEKYEAEEKAKITSMLYKQAQKSAGMAPFVAQFRSVGFFDCEAKRNAEQMTYDYGQLNEKEISKRIGIVAHKAYFDKVKDTSSFDLIMLAISNFEMQAPASAYYALQGMKTRFAAQELQLDLASIVNLTTYFEDISGVIIDFEDNMQLTMCEEYMKMKVKYPEMEKPFFKRLKERRSRGVYGNPYLILASKYEWKMGGEKFKSSKWKKLREKASEYHCAYGALEKTF